MLIAPLIGMALVAAPAATASIAPPLVAPAPITVWISSMNSTACGSFSSSLTTAFSRSSKSPR